MAEPNESSSVPVCPTCGEMMIPFEAGWVCLLALNESYEEGGEWRRFEASKHPLLDDEVRYLAEHGRPPEGFI